MATRIVLLRGVNLGPSRRVRMEALRTLLEATGTATYRRYLQSGNVVLDSPARGARLEHDLERSSQTGLGFDVDVFVRTRAQLAAVVSGIRLRRCADDPSRYLVTFLRASPGRPWPRDWRRIELAPEPVAVDGREIDSWHPAGVGSSELAKKLSERSLGDDGDGAQLEHGREAAGARGRLAH